MNWTPGYGGERCGDHEDGFRRRSSHRFSLGISCSSKSSRSASGVLSRGSKATEYFQHIHNSRDDHSYQQRSSEDIRTGLLFPCSNLLPVDMLTPSGELGPSSDILGHGHNATHVFCI